MIKNFCTIKDFAVFKDFNWDKTVVDDNGRPKYFSKINILFGRNYSGKTTLSRIVRSLETKSISDKYDNGTFTIEFTDDTTIDKSQIECNISQVRVFNEDFIKDKLLFISNPENGITPFAILGDNAGIEKEIQEIKQQLGSNAEGEETNMYLQLKNASLLLQKAELDKKKAQDNLDSQLKDKATNRVSGIKYQSDLYGDQNYNSAKIAKEIEKITSNDILSETELGQFKDKIKEDILPSPQVNVPQIINFQKINNEVKLLVEQPLVLTGKIEELVKNAMANKWVEEGCTIHKDSELTHCLFCGSPISEDRWKKLESHFDESSKKLSQQIDSEIRIIQNEIEKSNDILLIDNAKYYLAFRIELAKLVESIDKEVTKYKSVLESLKSQLTERKNDILNLKTFQYSTFSLDNINALYTKLKELTGESVAYGQNLETSQQKIRDGLRLSEIARFKMEIKYESQCKDIKEKEDLKLSAEKNKKEIENKIIKLEEKIKSKERLRKNEEGGAVKVNEYLKNFFGHSYIELRAVEGTSGVYFDVYRNDRKAYNLSEGERNLIAFAYFTAKLNDVETVGVKPIIWIDDPISSLDNNHVFFIFSLIDSEIIEKDLGEQVFISTHNIEFLRYLKRIHTKKKGERTWFLIERIGDNSQIHLLPKYMKEHVTEFNYLFHQIYKCATTDELSNHDLFYGFGNNARKFLEAYLYYRYPDNETNCLHEKLKRFFEDNCSATTIDRIDNEMSHLEGLMERGMSILDISEIKRVANYILKKIKEKDPDQYNSLLSSIGVEPSSDSIE